MQIDAIRIPWYEKELKCMAHREDMFTSSYKQLKNWTEKNWHTEVKVGFIDEPGLDAGGLSREWFSVLIEQAFSPQMGLMKRAVCDEVY